VNIYQEPFDLQRGFFLAGGTLPLRSRIDAVRSLDAQLLKFRKQIGEAVWLDLRKSEIDLLSTELSSVHHEIGWVESRLKRWTRPVRVRTNLLNLPGRSRILIEPLGNTLIIGTWNYPFLLNMKPAVSALAAGNPVIIKPSELAPHSSHIMKEIVTAALPPEWCKVIEGGVTEVTELLRLPFDKIFFTGSTAVGKIVMKAASEHLASLTLELGGKSPVFVLPDAEQPVSARRIAWGKFLNAGQSCIAPDFVLVHESIAGNLVDNLASQTLAMFGQDPSLSPFYGRIADTRHFDRLVSLLDPSMIVMGGAHKREDLFISPTLLYPVSFNDVIMKEEIFGPILPVIPYTDLDDAIRQVQQLTKPLALYVFGHAGRQRDKIITGISFGGGCVNDTVMNISNPYLPFGGVGPSGTGRYHGRAGILEFSNQKSMLYKATWIDPFIRYAPFTPLKEKILRKLL
jgi:aldehyde dehydrogenase (NAD+)